MTATPALDPIVRSIEVAVTPERAFDAFTAQMTAWWPLSTHSVFGEDAESVHLMPGVGGEIVERSRGGETRVWGTVVVWKPGVEVAFTWHPGG